jgi:ribose-phosphate pyrophosphokinase
MIVVPGPASQELGRKIADLLRAEIVSVKSKKFPDGESYIRLDGEAGGEKVVVVQTTSPPQNTHIFQLFLMVNTIKRLGAKKIVAVVPYLAYARQDKRFLPGEAISIETIIKLLEVSGVDHLLTINIHEQSILKRFKVPAENLSAIILLAEHFKNRGLAGSFSLAPDRGAIELAREANCVLKGGWGWLHKERDLFSGSVRVEEKRFDLKDRDVIIFDDIISTGSTTASAVQILKKQNVRKVYAACTHPLLVGDAKKKIMDSGADGIVGTDCVSSSVSEVSVAPIIAKALERIIGVETEI